MTMKDLSKLKHELEKEKRKIEKELKELEQPPEFGTETYDDESHESQEFANQLSIGQVLKTRLRAVLSSLKKMVGGTYGICENCGKKIEHEVLALVPESKLCRECKRKNQRITN